MVSSRGASRLLACVTIVGLLATGAYAAPREVPFPTRKTAVLRNREVVYTIDGQARIPPGIEITLQKGVVLRGRNGARLEVAGSFVAHGISGSEIRIKGVRIVLPTTVQQLHLDNCVLDGGSGVITEKDKPTSGIITIEKCWFNGETDVKKIADRIEDQADDPQNAVKVVLKKPMKRELKLAGNWSSR